MIKYIDEALFTNKNVLIRVDFNVPLDENFKVTDDTRIRESLKTIDKVIDDGGLPILMSHLGRPKGEKNLKYSLKPVAEYLINVFGYNVIFAEDCIGEIPKKCIKDSNMGDIILLENLRFYKEEEKNDMEFAKKLASLGDVYINDAFGTAHRAHASTFAVASFFQEKYAGYLLEAEINYLGKAVANPKKPFLAILGGAKISGKIDVITNLLDKCDTILVGGGMMFTFFKAMGFEIGKSLLEEDKIELAKELLKKASEKNINLILPVDVIVADKFDNDAGTRIAKNSDILASEIGMDIGPETIKIYTNEILKSKTIVWNGPMGVFEMTNFAKGTLSVAEALAQATSTGAITIVGGGDSVAAINQMKLNTKVSHVSTGGGASLEYLEGKELPGISALEI
jgi:phosphoglycerate kinase